MTLKTLLIADLLAYHVTQSRDTLAEYDAALQALEPSSAEYLELAEEAAHLRRNIAAGETYLERFRGEANTRASVSAPEGE